MTYKTAYHNQKANAKYRNIDWQFTYEEWLDWWGTDIEKRGRGKGKLCMARIGDAGPYHPNNCYKSSYEDNTFVAHYGKSKGPQPRELVERRAALMRGKPNPKVSKALKGKVQSKETNLKRSIAMKAYRQRLREAA